MRHHPMIWLLVAALVPSVFACARDTQPQQAAQNGTIIPIDSSGAGAAGETASNAMGSGGNSTQTGSPSVPMMPPSSAGAGGSAGGPADDSVPPAAPGPDASTPDEATAPDAALEEEEVPVVEEEEDEEEEEEEDD